MNNQPVHPTLKVADSEFIGYLKPISSKSEANSYYNSLKQEHPKAAHIPYSWFVVGKNEIDSDAGFYEDGEPPNSVGPFLFKELKNSLPKEEGSYGYILIVVRYFGHQLLGVTCGRLSQCYQSIAQRLLHKGGAFHQDFTKEPLTQSKYGLGAGDCEIILNIIQDVDDTGVNNDDDPNTWVQRIVNELEFGGFRGNANEELPRLQNLQAATSGGLVPVYRYPGNYRGDDWVTYQWRPLSLKVKKAVEKNLGPLVQQEMNHCVTNYYRDGFDFIGHHSDKDLDLDKDGVIVSVSFGDERILELKRRASPYDTTRIVLPHGSMLVLGPFTNKFFTHSILTKEESTEPRISLTFRRVLTFMDLSTGRLCGEGVSTSSLAEIRKNVRRDDLLFLVGFGATVAAFFQASSKSNRQNIKTGIASTGLVALTYITFKKARLMWCKRKEESDARAFFSSASVHGTKY